VIAAATSVTDLLEMLAGAPRDTIHAGARRGSHMCFRQAFVIAVLASVTLTLTACEVRSKAIRPADILLFTGTGTSPNDVTAVETILDSNHLDYSTADSPQLNEMAEPQMRRYRLVVFPGGDFIKIGNGLTAATAANIRKAVKGGTNYLGICAGAFLAGNSPYNGLNLTSGVRFGFYSAESKGFRKAAVAITGDGTPALDQYWEDGPQLTGWGAVAGTYPDGTPAIAEGSFGNGWVVLSGVHPEAPETWRRGMTFRTPVNEDHAYAAALIRAALNRTPLSHH
jgi:glutamine amidotransferase-like uncharacterized protein